MDLLPAIEIVTRPKPEAAVIWLHGLGADGNDFAPIVPELRLPKELGVRFIFPHAPAIPVTVNGGYVMPAWYDIYELDIDRRIDSTGLMTSAGHIERLLKREQERGVASDKIVLAGFSQGGAVAYELALRYPQPLAGLLTMSTYFATSKTVKRHPANQQLPIAIQHGSHDTIVPEILGKNAANELTGLGYQVTYQSYPMEHSVCPMQIAHISSWLQQVLGCKEN